MQELMSQTLQKHIINHPGYEDVPPCAVSFGSLSLGVLIANKGDINKSVPLIVRAYNLTESNSPDDTSFVACTKEDAILVCAAVLNQMDEKTKQYLFEGTM